MSRRFVSPALPQIRWFVGLNGLRNAEDFGPVAEEAIKSAKRLIGEIDGVAAGPEVVSVLDKISDSVCHVADVANFCHCVHPSAQWRQQSLHALQILVQYIGTLNTNDRLFSALTAALEQRQNSKQTWTPETELVAESLHRDFVSCGMGSDEVEEIKGHIASEHSLSMQFQRRAAEHSPCHSLPLTDISSLPEDLQRACVPDRGQFHLPVSFSNYHTVMHSVQEEPIRRAAYLAHFQSLRKNVGTLEQILKTRADWARALGRPSFAHLKLQDSVAGDPESVRHFLSHVADDVRPAADAEIRMLQEMKGGAISAWDVPFYATLTRQRAMEKFGSRTVTVFNLQSVINGIGQLLRECMEIEMVELQETELWDQCVQSFALFDQADQTPLGNLYLDLMQRRDKRPENAHYTLRCGKLLDSGEYQTPIVALVTNFVSGEVSFSELRTLLHEFGHVLHSLLSRTQYQHLFGTRGPLDLVEIPSHFFERLVYHPEALQLLAGVDSSSHRLIAVQSLRNAINVDQMFAQIRKQDQIQIAMADQHFHGEALLRSTSEIMEQVQSETGSVPFVKGTFKEAWLTHLTTYGARYYAYLFSRQIAQLAWDRQIGTDVLNKSKWQFIREHLFQPGGAVNPRTYVRALIGKGRLVQWKRGWIPLDQFEKRAGTS